MNTQYQNQSSQPQQDQLSSEQETPDSSIISTNMLPDSPPISPPESKQSPSSVSPAVPLFPDIHPAPPTTHKLPRLAPRPSTQLLTPSLTPVLSSPTPTPPTPSNSKRKSSVIEDEDEIALKRQKNTDAAQKRVSELESDNNQLNTRIAVLESEKSGLASKDHSLQERIRVLEAQLSEAHRALTNR
ncbi:hypothetical protein BD560DRAFT_418623 [Blakeslea trispora]|nr:hypothetical protein BD560DRAFT_418623 [Blakeslea trispora]